MEVVGGFLECFCAAFLSAFSVLIFYRIFDDWNLKNSDFTLKKTRIFEKPTFSKNDAQIIDFGCILGGQSDENSMQNGRSEKAEEKTSRN